MRPSVERGILLGLVLVLAHLQIILLIGPIIILFLGIIANPEETHAAWYGMLNTLGIFDLSALTDIERLTYAEKRHYFWFGEVEMAAILAALHGPRSGSTWRAGPNEPCIYWRCGPIPAILRVPAELIQRAMKADTDAAIEAFGKNEQVKKVFWTFFIGMAGLVLARVVEPVIAQQIVGLITGLGG